MLKSNLKHEFLVYMAYSVPTGSVLNRWVIKAYLNTVQLREAQH